MTEKYRHVREKGRTGKYDVRESRYEFRCAPCGVGFYPEVGSFAEGAIAFDRDYGPLYL